MILTLAVAAGLAAGIGRARWRGHPYQPPELKHPWLVLVAFLPQFIAFYLPDTRHQIPDEWAKVFLASSQLLLLGFAWLNRKLPGMTILLVGTALNFTVMAANGGFMPISPQTASRLVPVEVLRDISPGERFGTKDILLPPEETRFEWLSDRFLPPAWFAYQVAFSLGDVFLAFGVFRLLAAQNQFTQPVKQELT
ncbi:MAG: hypothetical protein C4583_09930 [Anaerolineaceae bacterium]|nr:MAG: hypothetical protein C4583_09930 [Anaerolineaceae bacterium]